METPNKKAAQDFLQLATSGRLQEAYDTYVSPQMIHHNPHFAGDVHSLIKAMEENYKQFPNKTLNIKHVIEEGETVAIHSHVKLNPESLGVALVHIFRFSEGKIVELWDIGERIPENSPNQNGMF